MGSIRELAEELVKWYVHYEGINYQTQLPTVDETVEWLEQADYLDVAYVPGSQEPLGVLSVDKRVLGVIGNPRHPFLAKRWALRAIGAREFPHPCVGFVLATNTPVVNMSLKYASSVVKYEDGLYGFIFNKEK